jgi:pimeloyl-ACP methyl ester carboxylesterase
MSALDLISRTLGRLGSPGGKQGNVIVVPGILGSDLVDGDGKHLWLVPPRLDELALAEDGISEAGPSRTVQPTDVNIVYALLSHALELSWNVRTFAYDWRKNIPDLAQELAAAATSQFGGEAFHVVAHSMGGLIARIMRRNNPDVQSGGKLIMLGTPNHGSWLAVNGLTTDLGAIAFFNSVAGIPVPPTAALATARTWPSAYQLLPCPSRDPRIVPLYDSPPVGLSAIHLDAAKQLHALLDSTPGTDSMVQIVGSNVSTLDGDLLPTLDGDGVVSHRLGRLEGVRAFKVLGDHVSLPANVAVITSITPLLLGTGTGLLVPF